MEKMSSHGQIGPKGAEKQSIKVYVGGGMRSKAETALLRAERNLSRACHFTLH